MVEQSTGELSFGAGYSTSEGAAGPESRAAREEEEGGEEGERTEQGEADADRRDGTERLVRVQVGEQQAQQGGATDHGGASERVSDGNARR